MDNLRPSFLHMTGGQAAAAVCLFVLSLGPLLHFFSSLAPLVRGDTVLLTYFFLEPNFFHERFVNANRKYSK